MPILLQPNSLYIATQTLSPASLDAFHWSFFITDENGIATQHHWRTTAALDERYESRRILNVQRYTENSFYLVFVRIRHWRGGSVEEVRACLYQVFGFRAGIPWSQNREQRLSCRTWVLTALRHFGGRRWLGMTTQRLELLEPYIWTVSRQAFTFLQTYGRSSFRPTVSEF